MILDIISRRTPLPSIVWVGSTFITKRTSRPEAPILKQVWTRTICAEQIEVWLWYSILDRNIQNRGNDSFCTGLRQRSTNPSNCTKDRHASIPIDFPHKVDLPCRAVPARYASTHR